MRREAAFHGAKPEDEGTGKMASGGARINRNAPEIGGKSMQRNASEWRKIPRRDASAVDVPDWPRGFGTPTQNEWEFWEDLWTKQAVALIWEENELHQSVAQYARVIIDSMHGRKSSNHGTLAKQLREELLLSPASLRSAMIAIVGSEEAEALDSITGAKAAAYEEPQAQSPLARLQSVKTA